MRNYFLAEWKKTRKIQILLIGITFLFFASFIGLGIYFANREVLEDGTQSLVLWGQLTFYNSSLLYPPMLAIFTGLLLITEFERKNIEFLKANQVSMGKLYCGKLVSICILLFWLQLFLFFIFIVSSKIDGIVLDFNLFVYIKWLLLSIIASFSIIALQSYITVKTKSFSKSLGWATVGSMLNFVLIFLSEKFTQLFPYSQPMIALRSRALADISLSDLLLFLAVNVIYIVVFSKLTIITLNRKN
ncbi:ABC transporter permease [Streptococcus phocae subsp. salmonis]|uniref:ABC transporter permease n=1 Tax=Streptococcus phocae TaxID=119224 RepID=UPI00053111B0|nr:ABC transporter permease [Streptococcus phocae]KGR73474.1 bacteroiocin operon protein ScnG-like protein [Streptococcus phocae subsp. salmonis]